MHTQTDTEKDLEMLDECEARESRLTEAEGIFIDLMRSRIERDYALNERERGELRRIWHAVTLKALTP